MRSTNPHLPTLTAPK